MKKFLPSLLLFCLAVIAMKGCSSGSEGSGFTGAWTGNPDAGDLAFSGGRSAGTLFGSVIDQEGKSIPGAAVKITVEGITFSSIFSGTDGTFQVLLATGAYDIAVSKTGFAEYTSKALIQAGVKTFLTIEMSPKFTFIGTVKLNTSGENLPNIPVKIRKGSGLSFSSTTTSEGKFFFQDLAAGEYSLLMAEGSVAYNPATYVIQILKNGTISPADASFLLSLNIGTTRSKYTITGAIKEAFSNAPLEFVSCSVKGLGSVFSDTNGNFTFTNVLDGQYELNFTKSGFASMTVNFSVKDGLTTPASLSYRLINNPEKDMGAIMGRYIDEANPNRPGIADLIVRVYRYELTSKKVSRLTSVGNATPTFAVANESYWEFESAFPSPLKSTHTSVDEPSIENSLGTFKITHLAPTNESIKYVLYIGWNDSYALTKEFKVGEPVQTIWNVLDPSSPELVQAWLLVDVYPNTTTYLTNYDREYK